MIVWGKESEHLIQQYKDSTSVPLLVNKHSDRLLAIASEIDSMPTKQLSIATAEGEQLNNIGKAVDAGRGSLTDSQYRTHIEFMQKVNSAGGNPEIIIEYIKDYCGAHFLNLMFDDGSAAVNIQLMTQGTLPSGFISELVYQLGRLVPTAVEVRLFHSETGDIFAVEDEGSDSSVGAGFSEEDVDPDYETRTTGGQFIDPIHI